MQINSTNRGDYVLFFSTWYNIHMTRKKPTLLSFLAVFILFIGIFVSLSSSVFAQTPTSSLQKNQLTSDDEVDLLDGKEATTSGTLEEIPTPTPTPRPDFTEGSEEVIGPLEELLEKQDLGTNVPTNFLKFAIRDAVGAGVPPNTIVLLLMLPAVAALIAGARHIIGLRGFGIFLPAALSVVFVAIGPVTGIFLFLVIVVASTIARILLRKSKIKLQYLPRMSLILWFVVLAVLGVIFAAPYIGRADLMDVSIFAVLILVLLAEDFSKVQLGKSAKTAINITIETLILSLVAFVFLTLTSVQNFALLHPEVFLTSVAIFDIIVGKFIGLRFIEFWRFRKIITG